MFCPYCEGNPIMLIEKKAFHHKDRSASQPYNTFLTVLYSCPVCGVTVETSQQVRITNKKES